MEAFTGFYVKTENVEAYIQHGSITAEFLVEATSQLTLEYLSFSRASQQNKNT